MKTTQKKKTTLSELHERLLKRLNPNLIPPVSASLSDIFKTSAGDDCSREQERESEKQTHDLRCGDPKSPTPREASSNRLVRNPDSGAAVRRIEKGLYRCSVVDCKCSFNRLNDLKMHMDAEHPHLNSYPCSFCFNEFEELDSMAEHVTAHVKNVFRCSHCQMSSDAKDELLGHISAEHPDLPKKITIYVKILNNDRQKRAALISKSANTSIQLNQNTSLLSSNRSEGAVIADKICANGVATTNESSSLAVISDKKSLNNEVTKSRSSRKSSRPIKWQRDLADDIVRIFSAEKSTTIPCDRCSFTCSSQLHLNAHQLDGHVGQNALALLKCKICRFSTDVKMSFQNHMVHHRGRHVIRYYICPYCSTDTNSMDVVEEHILDKHPTEAFRFEVLQETVEFLEDLFKCPVCRGMFLWKEELVDHVRSVHYLDELAEYLLENFPGAFPPNGFVPKSLFHNLLPETIDFEEQPVEQMVVSSDEENSGITAVDERKDMESLNEETSICVQPSSTRDKEKVFQFNCHTCSYTSCDYDRYMAHFKTHDSEKPDSLIKKLLTKPGVPPYTSGQSSDLELDVDTFRTSPSIFSGRKTGGMFHCHLCPFTCTKTVHFKRHLAIHTRNEMLKEGYKCGYCQFAHYRLNCVKFHLGKYHGDFPNKMIRIMDGIEIELGVNDDPGKVRSHSIQPSSSGPLLRTANEKRPTIRYGVAKMASEVRRPPECRGGSSSVSGLSSQEMSLSEFELQLPGSMIYPEAVKCPKCDFTNRVRINLIRHLKLHREEAEMNQESTYAGTLSTLSTESSELRALMMKDAPRPFALNASKHEDSSVSTAANKRSLILDEKPLLRSILCEKPVVSMQASF